MLIFFRHHIFLIIISFFFILNACQLQDPLKTHGIIYLENRSNKLSINKTNKNDTIKIMGRPQIKGDENDNTWIYVERILSKGKYHKLGQHIVKENNVLVLNFDKYGVLLKKKLINKDDINKIKFSKNTTKNELSRRSFVENFLQSMKQKMYKRK
jgi:outer membrane protein assembly factor BamE (lipoprotein component of BamABCDE complex)